MNLYSFKDGLTLGLMAMVGVFIILAIIGFILYLFELIFYKKEKQPSTIASKRITIEKGISKEIVAAIAAAVYEYITPKNIKIASVRITKHKKTNKAYEKLKIKRWKNG